MIFLGTVVLYLLLFFSVNQDGFWTLDNGLKFLTVRTQSNHPCTSLNIPIQESDIDPWRQATPLIEPFIHQQENRIIPVFPPLFIVGSSVAYHLFGPGILYWIPWSAAIGILITMTYGFKRYFPDITSSVIVLALATPLAFYALTLWEHTLSILFLLMGIALTILSDVSSSLWRWFLGGLLLGVSGMLRLEEWVIVFVWLFVSFQYRHRARWTVMFLGIILAITIWILGNYYWTGNGLPLQFSENWSMYGVTEGRSDISGWIGARWESVINLLFSAHPDGTINLLLNLTMILGVLGVILGRDGRIVTAGFFVILGAYITFLILLWKVSHPIASTGFTGGFLWCCPWVVLIFRPPLDNQLGKRLWVTVWLSVGMIILITPISRGVHLGPRILLGVIPMLALVFSLQLSRLRTSQVWIVSAWILVGLTVVYQARGIELLARQKNLSASLNQHVAQLKDTVVVTDLWWLPCDLARTWDTHRFFYISSQSVFYDLLYHMKASGGERFVYISESPASLANAGFPISVDEHVEWDGGERPPVVVERIIFDDNDEAWAGLANHVGMAQAQKGNFERALLPFESSVKWKPSDPDAWYRLGAIKLQVWDEDGARVAFETAVGIDSTHQYSLKALRRWRDAGP